MPLRQLKERRLARLRGLYAIVDASARRPPLELAAAFLRGGAAVVQLGLIPSGTELQVEGRNADGNWIKVKYNDLEGWVNSQFVTLTKNGRPYKVVDVTNISGQPDLIADYLGFGPIFDTRSKAGAPLPPPHGLAGLARAVQRAGVVPVVAIGGLTAATASGVAKSGAACAAAIGELCLSPDPQTAARAMAEAFARGAE